MFLGLLASVFAVWGSLSIIVAIPAETIPHVGKAYLIFSIIIGLLAGGGCIIGLLKQDLDQ